MDSTLRAVVPFIVFPLIAMGFMFAIKLLDDRRTSFNEDEELLAGKNLAVGLRKSGIYLGLAFGMAGALYNRHPGLIDDLVNFAVSGATLMVLLFIAFIVNDRIILCKVNNDKAVSEGNAAVGLVEFSGYTASGIIMHGSFSGEGGGILAAGVFFLLAQAALVAAFYLYEAITSRNICEEIEVRRNVAAGMDVAGVLIALAIILRASLAGPFTGWLQGLQGFGIYFAAGILALGVFRVLGNAVFVPRVSYDREIAQERNLSAATLSSVVQVALAMVIAAAF